MGDKSTIEWTEATWNPTVGCTRVSPGCKFCYAAVMHARLMAMGMNKYAEPFGVVKPWEAHLELPLHWKEPRFIFVNSMSDLFHDQVPLAYIQRVFSVMERARQHTFQVLTKRSERLVELSDQLPWPANVWMGVSIENQDYAWRALDLGKVPAAIRFLSVEPLLGPIPHLPLQHIHWVIVGGESGRNARPMQLEWAKEVRDQCEPQGVAFFLKQLGGRTGKRGGEQARLEGRTWREYPSDSHVRRIRSPEFRTSP